MDRADVIRCGVFDMQVCVPGTWSDEEVKGFADSENPAGTEHGWHIRKAGDPALRGDPERNTCRVDTQKVHIMLDA